jgi:plastocyanin
MRRALVIAVLAALAAGGFAVAATTSITLGSSGPQPATVTVAWGDTVAFTNADAEAHAVTIPRVSAVSPSIPPGGSWPFVFDGADGNYSFRQLGRRQYVGTIFVQVGGQVALRSVPPTITFGGTAVLRGTMPYGGTAVVISHRLTGEEAEWADLETVTAEPDGSFSLRVRPEIASRYRATVAAGQLRSSPVAVGVMPRIALTATPRRTTAGRPVTIRATITPASSATRADLMRYDPTRKRWSRLDRRRVDARGRVSFRFPAERGSRRLRVALVRVGLKPGFDNSLSRTVTVTGR